MSGIHLSSSKRTIPLSVPSRKTIYKVNDAVPTVSLDNLSTLNSSSSSSSSSLFSSSSSSFIASSLRNLQQCITDYLCKIKHLPYIPYSTAIQECLNNVEMMNDKIIHHCNVLQAYRTNDSQDRARNHDWAQNILSTSDQLYRQMIKYIADLITAKQIYERHTIHLLSLLRSSSSLVSSSSVSSLTGRTSTPSSSKITIFVGHDHEFFQSLQNTCDPVLVTIIQDLVKLFTTSMEKILLQKESFLKVVKIANMEQLKARSIYMFYQLIQDFRNLYVKDLLEKGMDNPWIPCDTSLFIDNVTRSKDTNFNETNSASTTINNLSRLRLYGNLYATNDDDYYATVSIENSLDNLPPNSSSLVLLYSTIGTVPYSMDRTIHPIRYEYYTLDTPMKDPTEASQASDKDNIYIKYPDAHVLLPIPSSFALSSILRSMDTPASETMMNDGRRSSSRSTKTNTYGTNESNKSHHPIIADMSGTALRKVPNYSSILSQFSVIVRFAEGGEKEN